VNDVLKGLHYGLIVIWSGPYATHIQLQVQSLTVISTRTRGLQNSTLRKSLNYYLFITTLHVRKEKLLIGHVTNYIWTSRLSEEKGVCIYVYIKTGRLSKRSIFKRGTLDCK
jgi:hypothetical protein